MCSKRTISFVVIENELGNEVKIENYLAKFYDVRVEIVDEHETRLEIYERGDDCEPLGFFVIVKSVPNCFQYRNISGNVVSGTAFTESGLRNAARSKEF